MTVNSGFFAIVLIVVVCALIIVLTKGKIRRVLLSTIAILTVAFAIVLYNYIDNIYFKRHIDIWIHSATQYIDWASPATLPLPSQTTEAFRTSQSSVAYFTTKSQSAVYSFYKSLDGVSIQERQAVTTGTTQYQIIYNGHEFTLSFMSENQSRGCIVSVSARSSH